MANRHFGEIGDVWKHLALSEILAIEKPDHYWESHAGSADYLLTTSLPRDYGVYYFMTHCTLSPDLAESQYYSILFKLFSRDKALYPGSPYIAMSILQKINTSYIFCDLDQESLDSIELRAKDFQIPNSLLSLKKQDGINIIMEETQRVGVQSGNIFVFIDPYDPFQRNSHQNSSVDLFYHCTLKGLKAVLWYGFESLSTHQHFVNSMEKILHPIENSFTKNTVWRMEIIPEVITSGKFDHSGSYIGSGMICCNLSSQCYAACKEKGMALTKIYREAILPDNRSGALRLNIQSITTEKNRVL